MILIAGSSNREDKGHTTIKIYNQTQLSFKMHFCEDGEDDREYARYLHSFFFSWEFECLRVAVAVEVVYTNIEVESTLHSSWWFSIDVCGRRCVCKNFSIPLEELCLLEREVMVSF